MCMNCGCGKPEDQHGSQDNITRQALEKAAEANKTDLRQTADNISAAVDQLSREAATTGSTQR